MAAAALSWLLIMGGTGETVRLNPTVVPVAPNPPNPPNPSVPSVGPPIDLSGWKLVLPFAGATGDAATVSPAVVFPPWLIAQPDGSIRFFAPSCGVTTPNSDHPRTELDSLTTFTAATSGPHTLTASVTVSQVPSTGDIIIGQIHGANTISSVPFVMLRYGSGQLRVEVKKQQSGPATDKFPLLNQLPLSARFDYSITDNADGTVSVTASYGGNSPQVRVPIPAPFHGATVRFQTGDYQQGPTTSCTGHDGGVVTFAALQQTPDTR